MYKTTKEILMQPLDKRATPQDLIGVFASVHGLKAADVEIINPQGEPQPVVRPDLDSFYVDFWNEVYRVRVSNEYYVACESLVTNRFELLEVAQFFESFENDKREPEYILTKISADDASARAATQRQKEAHDTEILRDINSWALVDKWVGAGRMFMGGDAYLQMSAQLQNQNAELFIDLDARKTVKIVSTWLPQLVNKELMAELIVHPQFRKLTDAGHLFILTDAYASKLLELHAAEDEYNRLEITNNEPRRLDELIWKRGRSITISKE